MIVLMCLDPWHRAKDNVERLCGLYEKLHRTVVDRVRHDRREIGADASCSTPINQPVLAAIIFLQAFFVENGPVPARFLGVVERHIGVAV